MYLINTNIRSVPVARIGTKTEPSTYQPKKEPRCKGVQRGLVGERGFDPTGNQVDAHPWGGV